ncbi:MAG: hypothetical protein OEM19_06565, partial [Deltaproteobacteria bacterium]|nr:hypothetical protein [Deltaproteobacteria bacterium]
GSEMAATKCSGKKFFLEKRIDQFCESSAELLTSIQSRYSGKDQGDSKGKSKRKKREIISISDLAIDMNEDEPLGDNS